MCLGWTRPKKCYRAGLVSISAWWFSLFYAPFRVGVFRHRGRVEDVLCGNCSKKNDSQFPHHANGAQQEQGDKQRLNRSRAR